MAPDGLGGAFGYRLKTNELSVVLPLEGAMHSAHDALQRMQYKTAGGGCTWLKPEDYDEVLGNALDLLVLPT